ncbi:MAG: hypothetical protein HY079_13760 [Elusimicrobia bacterium]|nr:hypothetical protein [Elusimicrobiota bacterium]
MAYAYPAPRTGTAQDLLRVVTRAYEAELEKRGATLPVKTEVQRRWVEPFFRALGVAAGTLMELIPGDWNVAFHDRVYRTLSAPRVYEFDPEAPAVRRARALAAELEARTGKAPALLALLSHPPVMGDLAHLNFELVRRATLVLRAVRGRPCRPRMVAATDPFALDATNIFEEGVYAGFMGSYHIGIDRLALGREHAGPALTPRASWTAMPRRLFGALAGGGEVGMVLSGGIPSTGRVLYGAREWARRVRHASPHARDAAAVERRLDADPSFQRFHRIAAGLIHIPEGTWRVFDAWLMAACAGLLPGEAPEAAAEAALAALEVPAARRAELMGALRRDLTRETPTRRRLFRILAGRVARRRPLVLLPIVHRMSPLGVEEREAWAWEPAGPGRVKARRADRAEGETTTPDDFADRFVQENFA